MPTSGIHDFNTKQHPLSSPWQLYLCLTVQWQGSASPPSIPKVVFLGWEPQALMHLNKLVSYSEDYIHSFWKNGCIEAAPPVSWQGLTDNLRNYNEIRQLYHAHSIINKPSSSGYSHHLWLYLWYGQPLSVWKALVGICNNKPHKIEILSEADLSCNKIILKQTSTKDRNRF